MKSSEFSEKFFEFAVDHELMNKFNVDIYIPSQHEEDELGWDIGFTDYFQLYFFQYKIVKKYTRNPKYLTGDSYRFQLHKNSKGVYKQNNLLMNLNKMGFIAGYVVPMYIELSTLKSLLYSNNVFSQAKFILPKLLSSKKSHYVNFDSINAYQHSEEQQILDAFILDDILTYTDNLTKRYWQNDKARLVKFIREEYFTEKNEIDNSNSLINRYLYENKIIVFALRAKENKHE